MAWNPAVVSSGSRGGSDVFGRRVNPVPMPDPFGDISKTGINLGALNPAASSALQAGFQGQLAPGTVNSIQDNAAQWSAAAGMPGFNPGSLGFNKGLRDLGLTAEGVKDKAFQNYASLVGTAGQNEVVNPALQHEVNLQNEVSAAAPNPASAASYAQSLFDSYLQSLQSTSSGYNQKPKKLEYSSFNPGAPQTDYKYFA